LVRPRDNDSFLPAPIGSPGMHFDQSWWWQDDSRLTSAGDYFERAVTAFRHEDPEIALLYLGRGSHPLQDIHAHGQIGPGAGVVPGWAWAIPGFAVAGPKGALIAGGAGQIGHAPHSILPDWFGLGDPDSLSYDWSNDGRTRLRRIPYEWRLNADGELYLYRPALRFNQRFIAAVLDTEDYIREFMEATGFSVKDDIFY